MMKRMGFVIRLNPADMERYKELHAEVWPTVLDQIRACHIRNYSIFLHEPEHLLFAYYEYHGADHPADMERMAADPKTQQWWDLCMPLMQPLDNRQPDEFWAEMDRIFLMEN